LSDLNSCNFSGRLTDNAVTREGSKGDYLTFSIANGVWMGGDSDRTSFIDVSLNRTGLAQYLTKGRQVIVTGKFVQSQPKEEGGQKFWNFYADDVFLGSEPRGGGSSGGSDLPASGGSDIPGPGASEDVPF